MKKLLEKRNTLLDEMGKIMDLAKTETRALNGDEEKRYEDIETEISNLDKTIAKEEKRGSLEKKIIVKPKENEERAIVEERVFSNYVRGVVEQRVDVNMSTGDNGAVIPQSIANKIIAKVYEICPIYQLSDRYNIGGTLTIPKYDEATQAITMVYATEFADLESTSGKHTNISLSGFLAGALTKISKSLINNSQFDISNFVITKMAESISRWIEKELLVGTSLKVDGLSGVTQSITAASATAVTADELMDVQEEVIDAFQSGAIWIMNSATRKAIRKLKDGQGNYLLNKDFNAKWGYTLLGKDVYTSDNMPTMAIDAIAVYYGNMMGLATKVAEEMNIEVLREKYATQHAIGVVGWLEIDAKVQNTQMIAKLVMAAI